MAAAQRFHELNPHITIHWKRRSLQEFADQSLDELCREYDLLIIDHPWAGYAAASGVLTAFENVLPAAFLEKQATGSVGPSHESYRYENQQWALALDAATPVASWRPDLIDRHGCGVPTTWKELLVLAKAGLIAMPGIPQDTLMNFYMLCAREGVAFFDQPDTVVDTSAGIEALEKLRELASYQDASIFDENPIQIYERMTRTDAIAYCPFAYGYSNYSRRGYATNLLKFGDVVSYEGEPLRTTLGGTGLAISSRSAHQATAAEFARFVAEPEHQRTQYTENGGQPGHRAAWTDPENNRRTLNYFQDTLPCLDRAYLRPRFPGSLAFQDRDGGGVPIREYMMQGGDAKATLDRVNELYRKSLDLPTKTES